MEVTSSPQALAEQIEQLPLGSPIAALVDEFNAAIAVMLASARSILFPDTIPWFSADDAARYTALVSRATPARYPEQLAAFFDRARRSGMDALAAMFTSPEAVADVEAASETLAYQAHERETIGEARARAAAAARAKYERLIAAIVAQDDGAVGDAARKRLAADELVARVAAVLPRHEAHARQVAEQQERERRAAQDAADLAADQAAAEVLIAERRRLAGLPDNLASGIWYEAQREHCLLMATTQRRLLATKIDGVRVGIRGSGRALYGTKDLARSLGSLDATALRSVLEQLDAAEGRVQLS